MIQKIDLSAENALFQVEYTVPYYSSDYGMYVCVAYVNREKAFAVLSPKLENASALFEKEYNLAQKSLDTFEKILALQKAQSRLKDFYEVYDFALAIAPDSAAPYAKTDKNAGECLLQINQLKKEIQLFVDGNAATSRVADKIHEIFTQNGFIVVEKGAYDYKIQVTVKNEVDQNGEVFATYPFVGVEVCRGASSFYSYSKKLDKCAGFDKETALRRADLEMCKVLEEELLK